MAYDWLKNPIVPRADLQAWHPYVPGESADNSILDHSGHSRDLSCSPTNSPVIQPNLSGINNQPAWYFSGDTTIPLSFTGSVPAKHIFVVMAFESNAFSDFEGVLSGVSTGNILTSEVAGDEFFGFGTIGYEYRKNDLLYDLTNRKAPMSGNFAVIEMVLPDGFPMDGITIGQQLGDTTRRMKGWFVEDLIYSTLQNDLARERLYRYFAMRYRIWQDHADSMYYFPFPANRTRGVESDIEHFLSTPYEGPPTALIRGDFVGVYSLPYVLREQAEFEAARAFWRQHYPLSSFVFRDYRFLPAEELTMRFSSPLREQGSDVTYRFN